MPDDAVSSNPQTDALSVSLTGACLTYGAIRLFDGLDLTLEGGRFTCLLGPTGVGKSSLLRLFAGLAPTATMSGLDCSDGRSPTGRIAYMAQQDALLPWLSVLDNVLTGSLGHLPLWRALLGVFGQARQRRACQLLHEVGLDERQLYRRASELSGGQQQRVGIARAFMSAPSLVLADEPVASLDPKISRDVLALLRHAADQHGATVLCSLHQVDLARAFADRIIGLRAGKQVFDTPPDQLTDAALRALYGSEPLPLAEAA